MKIQRNKKTLGYTLVELSAVVAVLGLVAGTALSVVSDNKEKKNIGLTSDYMNEIEEAINQYVGLNGYLPCPASPTAQESSSGFGRATDCDVAVVSPLNTWESGVGDDTIRGGVVPTRSLNLPDKYMYDRFGSRISYVTIKKLSTTESDFDSFSTSLTTGVIQINDANGNQINESINSSVVSYALISHGKDKKGAYAKVIPSIPATREACGSTALDSENCDNNDSILMDSWIVDSKIDAKYYYDQVRWHLRDEFFATSASETASSSSFTLSSISGERETYCGLKSNGKLWCWGYNGYGTYGNGTKISSFSPIEVGTDTWKKISVGNHSCGIKSDDTLWCWGEGGAGQLGDGTKASTILPVPVSGGGAWKDVDVGLWHSCGIKDDDTLWCWGSNIYGTYGNGTKISSLSPIEVGTDTWKKISMSRHSCGIKSDDTLWCWGPNEAGQLGDGTTASTILPVPVSGGGAWKSVSSDESRSCGVKSDNTAWCWGGGPGYSFGNGGGTDTVNEPSPVSVSGGGVWDSISNGSLFFSCGIKGDKTLWCWGLNYAGQLGDGTTSSQNFPVPVLGGGSWENISTAVSSSCAIKDDSSVWCWGSNYLGQLGDGTTTNSISPKAILN